MSINQNFAVMRHASYTDGGKITETGHQQIATAAKKFMEFAGKNGITEIEIWHSPQIRAKNTAQIFCNHLNVKADLSEKNFLDCDNLEIQNNLPNGNTTFILMISHQPYIEYYYKKCFGSYTDTYNCNIYVGSEKL